MLAFSVVHRKADRYPAIILFAHLSAILPGHSYRLTALFGKSGVIDHPSHHRVTAQHGRDHSVQTPIQHRFITPGGIGDHMVQRLVHPAHIVSGKPRGHWLDALALAGQQQAGAVVLQRSVTIGVPCGFGQALDICRKALFLWAWRSLFAHRTILAQNVCL